MLVDDDEVAFQGGVFVFPNPVKDGAINIATGDPQFGASVKSISLFDSLGRKILEEGFSPTIDLSQVVPGLYFMVFLNNNNETVHAEKIAVQR